MIVPGWMMIVPEWINWRRLMMTGDKLISLVAGHFNGDLVVAETEVRSFLDSIGAKVADLPFGQSLAKFSCNGRNRQIEVMFAVAYHKAGGDPAGLARRSLTLNITAEEWFKNKALPPTKLYSLFRDYSDLDGDLYMIADQVYGECRDKMVTNDYLDDLCWLVRFTFPFHERQGYKGQGPVLHCMPGGWQQTIRDLPETQRRLALAAWIMMAGSCHSVVFGIWPKALQLATETFEDHPGVQLDDLIKMLEVPCQFLRQINGWEFDFVPF